MKILLFGYTIEIYSNDWETMLVREVNKHVPETAPNLSVGEGGYILRRIQLVREIIKKSPEQYKDLFSGGLPVQKKFVEENWE